MASSGVEEEGNRRQNEGLNLISLLLKSESDYCTTSRTVMETRVPDHRDTVQRDYRVPAMMKEQWLWANTAMEWACSDGRSRRHMEARGGWFKGDRQEWGEGAGWASMLASITCITTCCHASGWLVGGFGGRLARSSCRVTLRRSSSRARVNCSKRASCSFTEARMLAAERTS